MKKQMSFLGAIMAAMPLVVFVFGAAAWAGEPLVKSGQRVFFLGDSITAGGSWPGGYITLTALGLKANGINIQAINAGMGGNRSREMLARLDRDVLANKADWVLLNCGVNDSNTGEWGVPPEEFRSNVAKIVERSQAAGVRVMILPATGGREDFSQIMRDIAKEKHCALAGVRVPYQKADRDNPFAQMANDGVHPNARGYYEMAMPVLTAFGLDEAQMAKARAAILDQPKTFEYCAGLQGAPLAEAGAGAEQVGREEEDADGPGAAALVRGRPAAGRGDEDAGGD